MRWLKIAWKVKKIVLLIGVTIFILSALRTAFAHFYHEKIRQLAIEELDEQLNAPFSFSEIDISFLENFPNVTGLFNDLTITGQDYFHNDTIAYAKEVHFELDLMQLVFRDRFQIESFHLESPKVSLIQLKDKSNFTILADTTSSDSSDFNLEVNEITIDDGELHYVNQLQGDELHGYDINFSGQAKVQGKIYDIISSININNFRLIAGKKKVLDGNAVESDLVVTYATDSQMLTFTKSSLSLDRFHFVWAGDVVFQEAGIVTNLSFSSDQTSFQDIFTLYPSIQKEDMKHIQANGDFKLSGRMSGLLASNGSRIPAFDTRIYVSDGYFKIDTLALPVKDIDIDLQVQNTTGNWRDTKIDLKAFHADLGKFPLKGRFKMEGFNNPIIDTDIISKIQLHDLEKIFPIKGVDMDGILAFELKAKGIWSHQLFSKSRQSDNEQVPPFNFYCQLQQGRFKYEQVSDSFEKAQFKLVAKNATGLPQDTEIHLTELQTFLNGSPIRGELFMKDLIRPMIQSTLQADLDLAKLEQIIPMNGYDVSGKVNLQMKVDGIYDQLANRFPLVNAKLDLKDGYVKSPNHPEPIESIDLSAELVNETGFLTDSQLKINHSDFLFEDEPVSLRGTVLNFKDYSYDLFFDGKIDLGRLTKVYSLSKVSLSGIVDAHLELMGTLPHIEQRAYQHLKADGRISISHLAIQSADFSEPIEIEDALLEIDPGKIVLKRLLGKAGKAHVQMLGDIHHYMSLLATDQEVVKADLFVKVDTLDLGALLAEQAHITDTTKTKVAPWLVPKNLDFRMDVSAKMIKHPSISVSRFDGNVLIRDGIIKLKRSNFILEDSRFHLEGDYNPHVGRHPFFDFSITIQDLDIQRTYKNCKLIHEMAPAIANTEGVFSGKYFLKGYLGDNLIPMTETIEGNGEVRIANAKVNGMKMFERISKAAKRENLNDPHIKDLVIQTEIKNDHLIVKPFSMKVSGFNTDIEGIHDFNGILNYIVRIELLPIEKLKIPFHVSGPYDDPKVALGKGHVLPED